LIINDRNNINGNNALAPQKMPSRQIDYDKQRDLEKLKKEHIKINKQKSVNKKAKILRNIIFCFIIGITVIYRYSIIYNIEKDILDVKSEISTVNSENENLKIGLLKYSNIKEIENNAVKNLNMFPKNESNIVYIDLEKNNFKSFSEEEVKENEGIVERLKKILY
jgi:cell division protein FtsL